MIIIEGTDKAGKTTLLTNIKRFFPRKIQQELQTIHFGILPNNWNYGSDYCQYIRPNVILDRFIDSERAYGPVYRGSVNPRLSQKNMSDVYRKCAEIGTIVIYCNPNIEEVMNRINLEGDFMIKKREQLELLRHNFDKIYVKDKYPLDFMIVDTTRHLDDSVYTAIVNKSIILERASKQLAYLNYRGSITPLSKYIIYTNKDTEEVLSIIKTVCNIPFTEFSIVQSRDIENKPVNISSLTISLTSMKFLFILGEDAQKDYTAANNKNAAVFAEDYSRLINLFPNN